MRLIDKDAFIVVLEFVWRLELANNRTISQNLFLYQLLIHAVFDHRHLNELAVRALGHVQWVLC
jgi:hypothetical protein